MSAFWQRVTTRAVTQVASHEAHVERMALIICVTVVIILVLIIVWRMDK